MADNASNTVRSPFETILNFRDVGRTVNYFAGQRVLNERLLYRSARPDNASKVDLRKLVDVYGIKTLVDLRTETELLQQQDRQRGHNRDSQATVITELDKDDTATKRHLPSIVKVNMNGHAYSRALIKQLSWGQYFKLVGLMATGYRTKGISVLGENVMQARGLTGLGLDTIDVSGAEIKAIFDLFADSTRYPIMIHCTQGKDRTGLSIALVLFLLGVSTETINDDYMLSDTELVVERASRLREIHSIGLGDDFASCADTMIESISKHLQSKYGSIEQYLAGIGVKESMQAEIKKILAYKDEGRLPETG